MSGSETAGGAESVGRIRRLIAAAAGTGRPVVLIDGRSGSGKTTLAAELVASWPGAQLVRLDDVYPGWDGLDAGSAAVVRDILDPVGPGWRSWDWTASRPGKWHPVDPLLPLVVEGVGALTRGSRELASFAVWVETDAATRKRRALARDGDTYAPHWDRWAAQEESFIEREHPEELADLVLSTS